MAKTQTQSTVPSAVVEEAAKALSPNRQSLKEALEAKQRAMALVGKAQKVFDAANAALEEALAEAGKHVSVDEDAVASRLAALKGEAPAKTPKDIRESRHARILANEEANAASLTAQAAQRELEDCQGNVARSEKICASRATSIISEITTAVIAAWDNVNLEREKLRTILKVFVATNVVLETLKPEQRSQIFQAPVRLQDCLSGTIWTGSIFRKRPARRFSTIMRIQTLDPQLQKPARTGRRSHQQYSPIQPQSRRRFRALSSFLADKIAHRASGRASSPGLEAK